MQKNGSYYLKLYSIITLSIIIVGYGLFQAQKIIRGPRITIESPLDGATYTSPLVEIRGTTANIQSLTLDNRPLYIDTHGLFHEKLLLNPGYNIIVIQATDRFKKKIEKHIRVILQEQ